MMQPKRSKYRKNFRGRRKGLSERGSELAFGEYGLKSLDRAWMAANQIEAARRTATNALKRKGRLWIRVFPDKPVSKKPPEVRMGSGKGDVNEYVAVVRPGKMLFEMAAVPKETAQEAMRLASHKLGIATKFVTRGEVE